MNIGECKLYIGQRLSRRELLEQLAEEAAELSQAALKCIRAKRFSTNVTTVSADEAVKNLREEFGDVLMVAQLLFLNADEELQNEKWQRWAKRLGAK